MFLAKTNNHVGIILIIPTFKRIKSWLEKRNNISFNIGITMTALSQMMNCGLTITQFEITLEQIIHLNIVDHEIDFGYSCVSFTAIMVFLLILTSVTTSLLNTISSKMEMTKKIFTWTPVVLSVLLINKQLM